MIHDNCKKSLLLIIISPVPCDFALLLSIRFVKYFSVINHNGILLWVNFRILDKSSLCNSLFNVDTGKIYAATTSLVEHRTLFERIKMFFKRVAMM
jgi:hypothetical protein